MPPPPPKMLKSATAEKDQQIEQMLTDCAYFETLEVFRAERNRRYKLPSDSSDGTHLIEKHGETWVCTFCDKTFTTKGSAKRHLVSTHSTDSKQFECPRCSSKFARRDDLYTHLRRMHSANELVESMIEEHKAELKGEHKGIGRGRLLNLVSHNEHLDVVLPSGNTICRPFGTDMNTLVANLKSAKACRTAKCNHWRVVHDDHEDVLVDGTLHHKNEDGEWECHGEIGSVEDFEFLVSTSSQNPEQDGGLILQTGMPDSPSKPFQGIGTSAAHPACDDIHDISIEELDFLLGGGETVVPPKQSIESLLLPGGSVLCKRLNPTTPRYIQPWIVDEHKHSNSCGHKRVRHGNHYDYIVSNLVESDHHDCSLNGTTVLEQNDTSSLAHVVAALTAEQVASQASSSEVAASAVSQIPQ